MCVWISVVVLKSERFTSFAEDEQVCMLEVFEELLYRRRMRCV